MSSPFPCPHAACPRGAVLLLASLVVLAACGGSDVVPARPAPTRSTREVRIDLLSLVPLSPEQPRTARIDAAEPRDGEHFVYGWSAPETGLDGLAAVHLLERVGAIGFNAGATPRAQTLRVRASGARVPITVEANGTRIGLLRPSPKTALATLRLPVTVQRPGRNTLALRVLRTPPAAAGGPHLALHEVAFEAGGAEPPTAQLEPAGTRGDERVLAVPPGARLPLFARMPRAARLHVAAIAGAGEPVAVRVAVDGRPARPVLSEVPARADVPLDVAEGVLAGVLLDATAATQPVRLSALAITGLADDAPAPPVATPRRPPNVVLYVADTLRADRLGCYGYGRGTSPLLDAFAGESVLFARAIAASSWTRPSTATLLTGLPPSEHGALTIRDPLRREVRTLAELLRGAGWATAGFVTNANVADGFGFGRGFDVYRYLPEDPARPAVHVPATDLHAAALAWLDGHHDRPFFLYLHATDVHAPYRPTPELEARFVPPGLRLAFPPEASMLELGDHGDRLGPDDLTFLSSRYDAEIAGLDADIGRLLAALRARGALADTIVVFVGDHGEEFREHGRLEHGRALYDETVRVPLLVHLPSARGGGTRIAEPVAHVDVAPTILTLAGIAPPDGWPGRALLQDDGSAVTGGGGEALVETYLGRGRVQALTTPREKVILDGPAGTVEVYDLVADPAERENLADARPVLVGYARQRLAALGETIAWAGAVHDTDPIDPATAARLRALGYLND